MPNKKKFVRSSKHPIQGPGSFALRIVRKFFPDVERVEDATKPLEIEVTKKDVTRAKKYDHNQCAMAVACKDAFKLDGVIIAIKTAYTIKGKTATRHSVPESTSREIVSFDRSGIFEPGTYHLDVPVAKLGKHIRPHVEGATGKGPKLVMRHHTDNVRAALGSKSI